jgi:acyl-coenzyme A synthetase/AMP-(fatty) acid ligase
VTGDVFRRDDQGFHHFIGRADDAFVSGGENIYPTVTSACWSATGVAQAAVVPLDDEISGQSRSLSWCAPRSGTECRRYQTLCADQCARLRASPLRLVRGQASRLQRPTSSTLGAAPTGSEALRKVSSIDDKRN